MAIDTHGNLLIQEDPGNNASVARVVAYDIDTGRRGIVAEFDPVLFAPATPGGTNAVLTADEESSGIIDVKDLLGDGEFLMDAQVHRNISPDPFGLVQQGQLMHLEVDDWEAVYTGVPSNVPGPAGPTGPAGPGWPSRPDRSRRPGRLDRSRRPGRPAGRRLDRRLRSRRRGGRRRSGRRAGRERRRTA